MRRILAGVATMLQYDISTSILSTELLDLFRLDLFDLAEELAREQNTNAHSSTLEWIRTIHDSHMSFGQWLTDHQPVFWIQGKPGSGKSILMDHLSTTSISRASACLLGKSMEY